MEQPNPATTTTDQKHYSRSVETTSACRKKPKNLDSVGIEPTTFHMCEDAKRLKMLLGFGGMQQVCSNHGLTNHTPRGQCQFEAHEDNCRKCIRTQTISPDVIIAIIKMYIPLQQDPAQNRSHSHRFPSCVGGTQVYGYKSAKKKIVVRNSSSRQYKYDIPLPESRWQQQQESCRVKYQIH